MFDIRDLRNPSDMETDVGGSWHPSGGQGGLICSEWSHHTTG